MPYFTIKNITESFFEATYNCNPYRQKTKIYYMIQAFYYTKDNNSINEILTSLREDEAVNNKIISLIPKCIKHIEEGEKGSFILYTIDRKKIVNVFVLLRFKLFISGELREDSIQLLVNQIDVRKDIIEKVYGPLDLLKLYTSTLKENQDISTKTSMETILMKLTVLNKICFTSGNFRKANKEDTDEISILIGDFLSEALNTNDMKGAKRTAESFIEKGNAFVLEFNKEIVCISAIVRNLENHVAISYVYTKLTCRGKGYATKCVGELSRLILDERGKHCILFADKHNEKSQKVYRNLGYAEISEFREIRFY
ncbi:MAG: GNAT family N-acetyltransferase [Chitinophagales bacterium]